MFGQSGSLMDYTTKLARKAEKKTRKLMNHMKQGIQQIQSSQIGGQKHQQQMVYAYGTPYNQGVPQSMMPVGVQSNMGYPTIGQQPGQPGVPMQSMLGAPTTGMQPMMGQRPMPIRQSGDQYPQQQRQMAPPNTSPKSGAKMFGEFVGACVNAACKQNAPKMGRRTNQRPNRAQQWTQQNADPRQEASGEAQTSTDDLIDMNALSGEEASGDGEVDAFTESMQGPFESFYPFVESEQTNVEAPIEADVGTEESFFGFPQEDPSSFFGDTPEVQEQGDTEMQFEMPDFSDLLGGVDLGQIMELSPVGQLIGLAFGNGED